MKPQDIQDLKQLIEFLKHYQVAEFDLDRGDMKIRLKFSQSAASPSATAAVPSVPAHLPPPAAIEPAAAPSEDAATGLHMVKSPIVGTFYGSPSPGAPAFVSSGDRVEKGQVICIVEAMKLMNEIESDASGEVIKCLVSNGQPIEFGQPLFSIRLD
ncbi:MAG: acetyl-CoA carboxylase biotin carboxyl carrier protein [Terracidiphilus sp.]